MKWKFILKTSGIVGIIAIPIQLIGSYLSMMHFYKVLPVSVFVVFISICVIAIVLTFSFVYRRTLNFRIFQGILTVIFALILSNLISFLFLIIIGLVLTKFI